MRHLGAHSSVIFEGSRVPKSCSGPSQEPTSKFKVVEEHEESDVQSVENITNSSRFAYPQTASGLSFGSTPRPSRW
eukprot:1222886-Pyramimonas_sp.AAC.1